MHRFQLACIALEQRLALDGAALAPIQPPPTGASVAGSGTARGSSAASGGTFGTSAGAPSGSQANPGNPANPNQGGGIYIGLGAVSPVGDPGTLVGVVISAGTSPILNVAASAASAAVTAIGSAIDSGLTALSPQTQTQTPPVDSDVPALADPTDAPTYFPDSAATAFAPAADTDQPTQTTPIAPY